MSFKQLPILSFLSLRINMALSIDSPRFRRNTASMHAHKGSTALRRGSAGRRLGKDIFVRQRTMYLSISNPTASCPRIRDIPAAPRLPALLRSRRPAPELRPHRRGTRRHPARRRPPHPHAGEAFSAPSSSSESAVACTSTAGAAPITRRSGASSSTSTRPPSATATAGASAAARPRAPAVPPRRPTLSPTRGYGKT